MTNSVVDIVITQEPTGEWIVDVPSLAGCHTYGATLAEARANARDAVGLWLESTAFELSETVHPPTADTDPPDRLHDAAG